MARSDAILTRLLQLHPKIIDLSLDRMHRLLGRLGHPERKLPKVIHVAGTNGKGSTVATLKSILQAAGLKVHTYTSPHLVRFHERITLNGKPIDESHLSALLEECEAANGSEPITFFEITTAAAFLAYSREPADYLVLEVGLGGRLDATNVAENIAVSVITTIDYDHQQYLGDTLTLIAHEKAGILKRGVPAVVGAQPDEARDEIERVTARLGVGLSVANQDWQAYEQQGRLVYQDEQGLLDLPLPHLRGRHQIDNAGNAIAAIRLLQDARVSDQHIAEGLRDTSWPARMQRLSGGGLQRFVSDGMELWLDGGHNASAGRVIAQAFHDINERHSRPLVLIWGMLNTKDVASYIESFAGLAHLVLAITIPGEPNAVPADRLSDVAEQVGLAAEVCGGVEEALRRASEVSPAPRVLICGSLYLAGHVLALHSGEEPSLVSGAARR